MAQTLSIDNYTSLNLLESTQLDADAAASASSLIVRNNQDFAINDFIVLGSLGTERCEKLTVLSVTGSTTIAPLVATKFAHLRFDALQKLFGDKIKVYTAPNVDGSVPADSAFTTLLTTLTIDIDNQYTNYTDNGGSSAFWYKYSYFNSISSAETSVAATVAVRGGNLGQYCSIDDIRDEAGMKGNTYITDVTIDKYRQEAQDEINGTLAGLYTIPFIAPINNNIEQAAKLIAAGLLLKKDYGVMVSSGNKDGQNKVDEGRKLLQRINTKDIILLDVLGRDLLVPNAGGVTSWPNNTTDAADANAGGGGRLFRISNRY